MPFSSGKPPIDKISTHRGNLPAAFEIVRRCFQWFKDNIDTIITGTVTPGGGSGGGGGGGAETLATRWTIEWVGNGPWRAGSVIDGPRCVQTACSILDVRLVRDTPGTGGSMILDILRRAKDSTPGTETSLYLTQANRPTIAYNDADYLVECTLPDQVDLAAGDILTMYYVQRENGTRSGDFSLKLEVA